jgi:ribosomal protein S18 acetylase RimI-like enzyme
MDRQAWVDLNRRGMSDTFAAFVASAGGEVLTPPGIFAGVNPNVPERSVFNSVVYTDGPALAEARSELAAAFARHGCAWTVWVPDYDKETAALLDRAGHRLDGEPRAMGMELDGFPEPDLAGIDWTDRGEVEQAALLNDHAYGYEEGTWLRGTGRDPRGVTAYVAFLGGQPASTVAARYARGDCSIWSVATDPSARGRGLASMLMRRALWDASQRGCETTTLQATKLGAPVYAALGYRDFGCFQMWEWRDEGTPPAH